MPSGRHSGSKTAGPNAGWGGACAVTRAALCCLGAGLWGHGIDARAADGERPAAFILAQTTATKMATITVAAVVVAEPGTETKLPLQIGPADDLPRNTFVRIRGLPARVALSDGHAIAPGTWAVPLFAVANLRAIVPAGTQGRSELVISLVDIDGGVVAETRSALVFAPAALVAAPAVPEANPAVALAPAPAPVPVPVSAAKPDRSERIEPDVKPPLKSAPALATRDDAAPQTPRLEVVPAPRPPVATLSAEANVQAQRLMTLGTKQLGDGNIAVARNYYSRAADMGLAEGALRVAETYDPAVLAGMKVQGVQPNPAEARAWYEKARALGATEADDQIKRLSAR